MKVMCNWNLTHATDKQFGSKPGTGWLRWFRRKKTHGLCPPCRVQYKAQGYRLEREEVHGN